MGIDRDLNEFVFVWFYELCFFDVWGGRLFFIRYNKFGRKFMEVILFWV